jgi:two-component system response regulator HydG
VGSEQSRRTEARILAATQRSLEAEVRAGRFREDLFYRLQVVEIRVPPLRERRGDIPALAKHLMTRLAEEIHADVRGITDAALQGLAAYDWPGNVRELEHALTRAMVACRGPVVDAGDFSLGTRDLEVEPDSRPDDDRLASVEANHIQRILNRTGGNKRQTARILDISRPRLDRLIEKYDLKVP